MTSLSFPSQGDSISINSCFRKLAVLLGVAAMADWLFFRQPLGISIAVFLATLAAAAVAANSFRAGAKETLIALAVLLAGLAPLAMGTTPLAACFGALATAYATITIASPERVGWLTRIGRSCWLIIDGSWQGFADISEAANRWSQRDRGVIRVAVLLKWFIPVLLGAMFVVLFAAANPLIENWFAQLNLKAALANLDPPRIIFWGIASLLVWPFIFLRGFNRFRERFTQEFGLTLNQTELAGKPVSLLNPTVVAPSLIAFNLLFAVQTILDAMYLWGHVALPNGISYAEYAHCGAYPLLVTALLAASFVLVTMRPGSDTEQSRTVRTLVFLWTGQNVLLVISSMLRLDLYVEMYSLTYLRVAAFIWMALVATGLILIAARIAFGRTNSWLVKMNLASLALVLYVGCFVNFPKIIADYNFTHSWETSGEGVMLDARYLVSLGPQALPALDRHIERSKVVPLWLIRQRNDLASRNADRLRNWRGWNYQDAQIAPYLQESQNGTMFRQ